MVRRRRRLFDVLSRIGTVNKSWSDLEWSEMKSLEDRVLRKSELVKICNEFGDDNFGAYTVPELRDWIRENLDIRGDHKSPRSEFSGTELYNISSEISHAEFLEAEDIAAMTHPMMDPLSNPVCFGRGETITINGTDYEVKKSIYKSDRVHEDAPCEAYTVVKLDDGWERLVMFFGWDSDNCKYKHSAALEKRREYDPYKQWKQEEYIKSIDFDFSIRDGFFNVEEGDEFKVDVVNVTLTATNISNWNTQRSVTAKSSRDSPYRLTYNMSQDYLSVKRVSDSESFGHASSFEIV